MAEKSFKVIGAAVVLPLEAGSERYLYRNAIVAGKGFTKDGLEHALKVGLIEETELVVEEAPPAGGSDDEQPTESWNHDRIDAWAASQSPAIEFVNADPSKPLVKGAKLEQIAAELAKRSAQQ